MVSSAINVISQILNFVKYDTQTDTDSDWLNQGNTMYCNVETPVAAPKQCPFAAAAMTLQLYHVQTDRPNSF